MFFRPSEKKILSDVRRLLDESYQGMVNILDFSIVKRSITIVLEVSRSEDKERLTELHDSVQSLISSSRGVQSVNVILTSEKQKGHAKPADGHTAIHFKEKNASDDRPFAPFVKYIIAVASGKGGVGKSTIANNLAIAFAQLGLDVGLLDADVYGPSQAHMMGVPDKKPQMDGNVGLLTPIENFGVKIMSMGFLIEQEKALIWRGPMVQSAITQMLRDVNWGKLDILVVDMPPGTGDVALTLAQKVPLAGAVIVSTPQDIALMDAIRSVEMFRAVNVPILGIIENMSIFCCPNCGHEVDFFGRGGVRRKATQLDVTYLGDFHLDASMREACDAGKPIVVYHPLSEHARTFKEIALKIKEMLDN